MNTSEILSQAGEMLVGGAIEIVDCSSVLGPNTPVHRATPEMDFDEPRIEIHPISEYDSNGPFWAWNWLSLGDHSGTHFDAPGCSPNAGHLQEGETHCLDVRRTIAPANVVDCVAGAREDPDFLLTAGHIREWEAKHGPIGAGEWVLMRTDWDSRSRDQEAFLNADKDGHHYPGPSHDAIEYLLSREIAGWGTQCISTDAGLAGTFDPPFPARALLHGKNCFGLAGLANLDRLPPKGAILIAAPLKLVGATGSPIRALALVAKTS